MLKFGDLDPGTCFLLNGGTVLIKLDIEDKASPSLKDLFQSRAKSYDGLAVILIPESGSSDAICAGRLTWMYNGTTVLPASAEFYDSEGDFVNEVSFMECF
jgi:hypothetical protein